MGSILYGLTNQMVLYWYRYANGCSTGNCTFPMMSGNITHSTIGMCSQCIDITPLLQGNGTYATLAGPSINNDTLPHVYMALPNGLLLQPGGGGVLNASAKEGGQLDSILSQAEDYSFTALMPVSIFNWTMIAISRSRADRGSDMANSFLSAACSIYSCMRHYHGWVAGGNFSEYLVSTAPALRILPTMRASNFSDHGSYAGINASCVIDGNTHNLTDIAPTQIGISQNGSVFVTLGRGNITLPSECINEFETNGGSVAKIASSLTNILTGSCSTVVTAGNVPCSGNWWLQGSLWSDGNATLDTVQNTFKNVAESITTTMRWWSSDDPTVSAGLVYGTVKQTTTCIAFSWEWMLFPALLIILTIICLVVTMVQPIYRVESPLWKSSILPLLYASPGTQLMAPSGEARDIEAKSEITVARLKNSGDKWSFVDISSERV